MVRLKRNGRQRVRILMEDDVMDRFDELARKHQTTFNQVVNTAIRKYAEWSSVYPEFGVVVSKTLLRSLFATAPEAVVREMGERNGREEGVRMVVLWRKKLDLESVLHVFGKILAHYSGLFVLDYSKNDDEVSVVLKHDMGLRASAYYAEYAKSLCRALGMTYEVTETEGQVLVKARGGAQAVTETEDAFKASPGRPLL